MATTFVAISTVTVGSGGSVSIDFNSIPQTYTDLCIKLSTRAEGAGIAPSLYIKLNGSTTTFTNKYLQGSGSGSAISGSIAAYIANANGGGSTIDTFGNTEIYIPNYTKSEFHSFFGKDVSEQNGTTAYALLTAGLFSTAAAITSISIYLVSLDIAEYSTATLYGIKSS